MARIWLDIYSKADWNYYVTTKERTQPFAEPPGKARALAARFHFRPHRTRPVASASSITSASMLGTIGKRIVDYHGLKKADLSNLPRRRELLEAIADVAGRYLEAINRSDIANQKANFSVGQKTELLPYVRILKARAERKASYLAILDQYYKRAKEKHTDPQQLVDLITKTPRKVADGLYGLMPGVRMEKVDPLHRNFEFHLEGDGSISEARGISKAFAEWVGQVADGGDVPPFFLWLEGHPMCTGDPDENYSGNLGNKVHTTQYGPQGETTIELVIPRQGLLRCVALDRLGNQDERRAPEFAVFDTRKYGGASKLPFASAYVWSRNGEIYTGPHGTLHHSSLDSGRKVACAGMLLVENGKVKKINADSGHYQPPREALMNMAKELLSAGVFAPDGQVGFYNPDAQALDEVWEYLPAQALVLQRIRR